MKLIHHVEEHNISYVCNVFCERDPAYDNLAGPVWWHVDTPARAELSVPGELMLNKEFCIKYDMTVTSNVLGGDVEHILSAALQDVSGEVYLLNPTASILAGLFRSEHVSADLPDQFHMRVVATESRLKTITDPFLIASMTADLIETDLLTLRSVDSLAQRAIIITPVHLISVVQIDEQVIGLTAVERECVESANASARSVFEAGEAFSLRTPPLSKVQQTLKSEIGEGVSEEFRSVIQTLQHTNKMSNRLDGVTLSLLVAARHNVLLYEISKWGEDVGVASKATFSRTKSELENKGLISTEKVPIEVGRPRLRLQVAAESVAEADPEELAENAYALLNN
jgi:hypothetical protein